MKSVRKGQQWFSESLARGLTVIQAFSAQNPRLRISGAAKITGLSRAAARRFLMTLQELGYLSFQGDEFYLRPRVLDLGFSYLSSVRVEQIIQPILNTVADRTRASSTFAVIDDCDVMVVARTASEAILTLSIGIGGYLPAHATSLGQVLLASLPSDELDKYFSREKRVAFTRTTITDAGKLRVRLRQIQKDGYAVVSAELAQGITSVAVPVVGQNNELIGAINANAYPAKLSKTQVIKKYLPILRAAANELEAAFKAHEFRKLSQWPQTRPAKKNNV